eukprot:Skav204663  [mRNA]  locus=scaffold607:26040:27270:- [translate_table: standard]
MRGHAQPTWSRIASGEPPRVAVQPLRMAIALPTWAPLVRYNLPEGRCQIRVEQSPVEGPEDLKKLLEQRPEEPSLVDIDAQGAEETMLCCGMISWLSDRVERLHVSTHTPRIHDSILQWLREAEWTVETDAWYILVVWRCQLCFQKERC